MFYWHVSVKRIVIFGALQKMGDTLTSLANVRFSRTLLYGVLHKCQSSLDVVGTGSGRCSNL
jgi:hypothetical protein